MDTQLNVKIAICDDTLQERETIKKYLSEYLDQNELVAHIDEFERGEDFLCSDTKSYNLVIMDIFMDKLNGMETAKRLITENQYAQVVFCSTSSEYAAESYDISALYYLLKPLDKEKFFAVLDKFFAVIASLKTITVKSGRIEESIFINDIIYVESSNHKSIIHTKNGPVTANNSMAELEKILTPYDFIRPIRYAIISLKEIVNVPSDTIKVSNGTVFSISRKERENVKQAFTDYKWKVMFGKQGG